MKKVLIVGDAACDSGFARGTHNIADGIADRMEVVIMGLNYHGDPHPYRDKYKIYPAYRPGTRDLFGTGRLLDIMDLEHPDVVLIQNDPWNFPGYMEALRPLLQPPPIVGAVAVDGENCLGANLNKLDHAIFWTTFGRDEAVKGGFTKPSTVIPLGVDREIYHPGRRIDARKELNLPPDLDEAFIVLNVNRNQPRKRLDLTIEYFADWVKAHKIPDAFLFLHVCPTGDQGYDLESLAKYYGVNDRVMFSMPGVYKGLTEKQIATIYRAADVILSTSQGEGMGLPALESMACGVANQLPDFAAYTDWAAGAFAPMTATAISTTPKVSVIGRVPEKIDAIRQLHKLYTDRAYRADVAARGYARAIEDRFNWKNIGDRYYEVLEKVCSKSQ